MKWIKNITEWCQTIKQWFIHLKMAIKLFKGYTKGVPPGYIRAAKRRWLKRALIEIFVFILPGLFIAPFVIWFGKLGTNRYGESVARHLQKYMYRGASGWWYFKHGPKLLWLWGNDEDGLYREPSGKGSARCNGKEQKFWAQYNWIAIRNPANNARRFWKRFNCQANNCDFEHWGDYVVNPHPRYQSIGWHFVMATDRDTGRKFYGFRCVVPISDTEVLYVIMGTKLKPEHAKGQDDDDNFKGFTNRFKVYERRVNRVDNSLI